MDPMPVKWYLIWTLAVMGLYITLARKNDSKDSCSTILHDEKIWIWIKFECLSQAWAARTHSSSSALARNVALCKTNGRLYSRRKLLSKMLLTHDMAKLCKRTWIYPAPNSCGTDRTSRMCIFKWERKVRLSRLFVWNSLNSISCVGFLILLLCQSGYRVVSCNCISLRCSCSCVKS